MYLYLDIHKQKSVVKSRDFVFFNENLILLIPKDQIKIFVYLETKTKYFYIYIWKETYLTI